MMQSQSKAVKVHPDMTLFVKQQNKPNTTVVCLVDTRGSVANMLITLCRDNICRLWVETILPEDGLVDLNQLDPNATTLPMFHTQRHRNRFMQRLHHIR